MRNLARLTSLLVVLAASSLAQSLPPELQNNPNVPTNLKPYFVGFLVEAAKPQQPPTPEERQRLMEQHLAYIRSQVEAGRYLVAGPFLDDSRIGGMAIINAASAEEAKKLLDGDPLVKAGRLATEVHPAMFVDLSAVHAEFPKAN